MGAPFPSKLDHPEVAVRVNGEAPVRVTLDRTLRPYDFVANAPPPGEPLLVQIDTPTWCGLHEPAELGIRVDRLTAHPVPE